MHEPTTPDELDHRLDAALASLPRETAEEGFTEAVLARLGQRQSSRRQWQGLAAAALVILALGLGSLQWQRYQARLAAVERVAVLNAEYQVLQDRLEELEARRDRARPLIYLSDANDDVELVLDLGRLARVGAIRTSDPAPEPDPEADDRRPPSSTGIL